MTKKLGYNVTAEALSSGKLQKATFIVTNRRGKVLASDTINPKSAAARKLAAAELARQLGNVEPKDLLPAVDSAANDVIGDHRRAQEAVAAERKSRQQGNTRSVFRNFEQDGEGRRVGLSAQTVERTLQAHTGGWPKRFGMGPAKLLFVEDSGHRPLFLETSNQLFAWIGRQFPGSDCNPIEWTGGDNFVSEARFHAHLRQSVEGFNAVESFPHHPPIPGHYYMHPSVSGGNGKALRELLGRFRPASPVDADLIKAFVLSLFWGGPPGARPAWLFTSKEDDPEKGRGVGKSKLAMLIARLVGGYTAMDPNEKISDLRTRLLSPSAQQSRVVLIDNVKTLKFSCGELEGLITSDTISGHMMYHGEGIRPNTLTFIITLNGASLSKDMAQRVIPVQLERPDYAGPWEAEVISLIESKRWEIIGDILAELRRPVEQPRYEKWRWATWGAHVLARVAEPYECQKVILERQAEADDDQAEAEAVRRVFVRNLQQRGHDPDRSAVFIPSDDAAAWVNEATNERWHRNKACAFLNTLAIQELRRSKCDGDRGWRWTGADAPPSSAAVPLGDLLPNGY